MILLSILACTSFTHIPGCLDLRRDHISLFTDLLSLQAAHHPIPATTGWQSGAAWFQNPGIAPYITDSWYSLPENVEVNYDGRLLCLRFTDESKATYCERLVVGEPLNPTCNGDSML